MLIKYTVNTCDNGEILSVGKDLHDSANGNGDPIFFTIDNSIGCTKEHSLLITLKWSKNVGQRGMLLLGTNTSCPTEDEHIRASFNMSEMFYQYTAIYPYETCDPTNSSVYIVSVSQFGVYPSIQFTISLSVQGLKIKELINLLDVIDLSTGRDFSETAIPGIRKYFSHQYSQHDKLVPILLVVITYTSPSSPKLVIRSREKSWPIGNKNSTNDDENEFHTSQFSISPVLPNRRFFYTYHDSIQEKFMYSIRVIHGSLCENGCGDGICDLISGKCKCPKEEGKWGDACEISGCIDGSPCDIPNGKGKIECVNHTEGSCVPIDCNDWYKLYEGECRFIFPVTYTILVGVSLLVIGLIAGTILGIFAGRICTKRSHYHVIK